MTVRSLPPLLVLDAQVVATPDVFVAAPIDATDLLQETWSSRPGVTASVHPYLESCGVYVIADGNGRVSYIGCTTYSLHRYLKRKLGFRRLAVDGPAPCTARYWDLAVRGLDRDNPIVRAAIDAIKAARIRIWLVPVLYTGPINADCKRSVLALESLLLERHRLMEGHYPVLNCRRLPITSRPEASHKQKRHGKIASFLRRHPSSSRIEIRRYQPPQAHVVRSGNTI